MTELQQKSSLRNSNVELLKIVAMFLIVISHVSGTFASGGSLILSSSKELISKAFAPAAGIGNTIFFVSSAWFLTDSRYSKLKKVLSLCISVWIVSIIILSIGLFVLRTDIDNVSIIRSIFPNICANNWYTSWYIVFYLIHPLLNKFIDSLSQFQHFKLCILLVFVFFVVETFKAYGMASEFKCLNFDTWITTYLVISYLRKYHRKLCENKIINLVALIISSLAIVILAGISSKIPLVTISFEKNNPLVVVFVLSLFNIVRGYKFENRVINSISSLSLLIYITHENIIFRTYFRLEMCNYITEKLSDFDIIAVVLITSIILFAVCTVISFVFRNTIGKGIDKVSLFLTEKAEKIENVLSKHIMIDSPF